MATVFISHSGQDRELTKAVAARLREVRLGLFVDFDPDDGIPAGENWEHVLYRRIRSADALVVVLTPSVPGSSWCETEVRLARALGRLVLVLRAEPGVVLPDLSDVQWIETSDPRWPDRIRDGLIQQHIHPDGPLDWDRRRDPYPGLAPFTKADAGVFFAREQEIDWLVGRLQRDDRPPVLAVVGRSGSGKSSLVYAGLLPRVPESWFVVPSVRPGAEPVRALTQRLVSVLAEHQVHHDVDSVLGELDTSPARMAHLLDELADAISTDVCRAVLLVVDQAEELQTRADAEQQRRFLELVGYMADAEAQVCVVMTLRPELLSGTPERSGLADLHPETLMLEPIAQGRLHEVIERPAWRADVEFADDLVDRMVSDAAGGDALPLLAHTLRELVDGDLGPERLVTWERYRETGGVLEALDVRSEHIARGLERKGRSKSDVVVPTMLRFAQLSDQQEPVSRPVDYTGLDEPARDVVDAFVAARLLSQSGDEVGDPGGVTVRVAHEALLRRWVALEVAIRRAGAGLRLHAELARLAGDWDRTEPESKEDYLLTGDRLVRVEALLQGRMPRALDDPARAGDDPATPPIRLDFSTREREFVAASRAHEDDQARRRKRRLTLLAILVVLALVGATVAVIAGVNASTANAAATSRALSVAAGDAASSNPAAAAMFALAAYRESPTAEAEQALFSQYIANQNLGTVFSGAPGNLRQAQVSQDGRVVVGLTDNGLLSIWTRTPSGGVEQRQSSPADEAESFGLSLDGTTVWLKRRAGLTRYDVATGAAQVVGPLEPTDVNDSEFAVSADGRTIAAIAGTPTQSKVRAWDTTTGRVVGDLPLPSGLSATTYGFGPGHTMVIDSELTDKTVERWTPGDPTPPTVFVTGVSATAMVEGADTMVVCQSPPDSTDLNAPVAPNVLSAVRVSDGAILRTLSTSRGSCANLATDARGDIVGSLSTSAHLTGTGDDSESYDMATGRSTTFASPVHAGPNSMGVDPQVLPGLVPGPNGPQIVVVGASGVSEVPVPSVARSVSNVVWVGLPGDGTSQIAVADGGATLVNATTLESPGRILATVPRPAPYWKSTSGDVVAHGSLLADRVAADHVVVRHLPDLAPVAEIPTKPVVPTGLDPDDLVSHTLSFDDAGNLMMAVGPDVTIWDPVHGRQVGHVDLAAIGLAVPDGLLSVRPGRDPSQLVVVAENQPDVHYVDIATSREVGRLPAGPDVLAAGFDTTRRYVDLLRRGGELEVWDTRSSSRVLGPLSTVPPGPVVDATSALAAGFIDSGDLEIGSGSRLRVYDVDSPAPVRTLDVGEGQQINAMSADGQVITTQPASGSGLTLSLKPVDWENEICRVIGDRSFTDAERNAAPASVPSGPLCPGS